jgi:hypothetical protein
MVVYRATMRDKTHSLVKYQLDKSINKLVYLANTGRLDDTKVTTVGSNARKGSPPPLSKPTLGKSPTTPVPLFSR